MQIVESRSPGQGLRAPWCPPETTQVVQDLLCGLLVVSHAWGGWRVDTLAELLLVFIFSFRFCLAGIGMSPLPLPEFTPLEHTARERQGGRKNLSRSQEASVSEEILPRRVYTRNINRDFCIVKTVLILKRKKWPLLTCLVSLLWLSFFFLFFKFEMIKRSFGRIGLLS